MALIKCNECGAEINSDAISCPKYKKINIVLTALKDKTTWIAFGTIIYAFVFAYSTLKPLRENIIAEGAKELRIVQKWGRLDFYHYFQLKNVGEKQGAITSIEGLIDSKDNPNFKRKISAKYYGRDSIYHPMLNITLSPDDTWEYDFHLYQEPSKESKDSVLFFSNKRSEDIEEISKKGLSLERLLGHQEIKPETFASIKGFILNEYKDFREGEYQYIIALKKNNDEKPFYVECYSFVIYVSDLQILENGINNYGVWGNPSLRNEQTIVSLTPISDQQTRRRLSHALQAE